MGEGKRHKLVLDLVITDPDGNETLGGNIRIGQVKQEHLALYESVIDKHINNAKVELAKLEAEGAFA